MKNFPFTNLVNNLEVVRPFGPAIAKVQMPENLVIKLNDYADKIIKNDKVARKLDHGKYLAGNVKQEFIIDAKFEFQKYFFNFLKEVASAYILKVTEKKIKEFKVINSWIIRQFEDEYNPVHYHTGHLSGVGYLKVPLNWGDYSQNNKRKNQNGKIDFIFGNKAFLSEGNTIAEPKVGDFYMFPNYLYHTVYPFKGNEERRSVSFNANIDKDIYNA
tara:strand:+ start:394 stop:1041 length:648 start_codon:yes stop_codon:yes gene_type:complete